VIASMTLEQALSAIGESEVLLDETVVPASCPVVDHSPYRLEYGWMFWLERRVARALEPSLPRRRAELIGPGGLVSESLANAFLHGNGRDADRPIAIRLLKGRGGVLLRIHDSGRGFDVASKVARLRSGRQYFEVAGRGLSAMASSHTFRVFFGDRGSTLYLLHLFGEPSVP
jgi:hypothetical protein